MAIDIRTSVVQITSADQTNRSFGTGFLFHRDNQGVYVLTCAHVVDGVGGAEQVKAGNHRAEVVAIGEPGGLDLAVLRVEGDLKRSLFALNRSGAKGDSVTIPGFHKTDAYRPLREVEGRLGGTFYLQDSRQVHTATIWDVVIEDASKIQPGYSGAPVIRANSGLVVAVMIFREGDQRGAAISVEALPLIWADSPDDLFISSSSTTPPKTPAPAVERQPQSPGAFVDLGSGNQIGSIVISNLAGGDISQIQSAVQVTRPAADTIPPNPDPLFPALIAAVDVYLAAHPKLAGKASTRPGEMLIDWAVTFKSGDPEPMIWSEQLIPDLVNYCSQWRDAQKNTIRLRAFARNSTGLAFGYVFNKSAGFHIHYTDNRNVVWKTDDTPIAVPEGIVTAEPRPPEQVSATALRQILRGYFNDSELRDLCFDLGIDYEHLSGQGTGDKARELITYMQRRGRTTELVILCYRLRPNADWPQAEQTISPERLYAPHEISPLVRSDQPGKRKGTDLVLELAVTQPAQQVQIPVNDWIKTSRPPLRKRILLELEGGVRNIAPAEGLAIAHSIRTLVNKERHPSGTIHIFGPISFGLALLIGWHLHAAGRIQSYEIDEHGRYQPTCLLF